MDQAIALANAGRWEEAHPLLLQYTATGCSAVGHYLLGYVAAKRGAPQLTLKAETKALSCSPALAEKYRGKAEELISWSVRRLASPSTYISFVLSRETEQEEALGKADEEAKKKEIERLINEAAAVYPEARQQYLIAKVVERRNSDIQQTIDMMSGTYVDPDPIPGDVPIPEAN